MTILEEKLMEQIIQPALSIEMPNRHLVGRETMSQALNFTILLIKVKEFYQENGGKEWAKVLMDSKII